ncbi:MAG: hypothetical protein ACI8T1_004247 [Verrucomicrobiales bacterium]|jgi:uncharacterized protein GlcG (DUF336 family)
MVGKRIGGVNVFGGGLALYNTDGELVGAICLSGDTSRRVLPPPKRDNRATKGF